MSCGSLLRTFGFAVLLVFRLGKMQDAPGLWTGDFREVFLLYYY